MGMAQWAHACTYTRINAHVHARTRARKHELTQDHPAPVPAPAPVPMRMSKRACARARSHVHAQHNDGNTAQVHGDGPDDVSAEPARARDTTAPDPMEALVPYAITRAHARVTHFVYVATTYRRYLTQ